MSLPTPRSTKVELVVCRLARRFAWRYATADIAGRHKCRPYGSKPHRGASLMSRYVSE